MKAAGLMMPPCAGVYEGDGRDWDAYVRSNVESTNYHLFGWKAVIERSFGHKAYYLAARGRDGGITGVLPLVYMRSFLFGRFIVSLPFFNYGGLLSDDGPSADALLDSARGILDMVGGEYLELRHLREHGADLRTKRHKVTMILDLQKDADAQWKGFDPKLRNQVRKAQKGGLSVNSGGLELLDGFYDVFANNMRDLGTPVYGKGFFQNVLGAFPGTAAILSVSLGEKVIASGLATWYRDTLEVPWASSLREYRHTCANNLLYWEAIRFAIEKGLRMFDFGRSTPGEGTFKFKEQWGARPVGLCWQYRVGEGRDLPELNPKNPKYGLAIKIWKRLPLSVTRIIGPRVVRNVP